MSTEDDTAVDNDGIADALHKALSEDEKLSDDDRRTIAEKLAEKHGGKAPAVVKPGQDHWTTRKLW